MSSTELLGTAEQLRNTFQNWPENAGLPPNEFVSSMGHLVADRIPSEGVSPELFDQVVLEVLHDTWATHTQAINDPVTEQVSGADAHDYLIFRHRISDIARVAFGPSFEHRLRKIDSQRASGAIMDLLNMTSEDFSTDYQPLAKKPEEEINEAALPVAEELWTNPNTRLEAIELVLGRKVDAEETSPSSPLYSQLGIIYRMKDPKDAIPHLVVFKELERD